MPEFVRKALLAQGLYDPDEIAAKAAEVDLDAPTEHEQIPLMEVPPTRPEWYDR